jgi:DegV family protein with EDD domain
MTGVKIVTDSSCDLPQQLVDDFDIAVVSLTVRFGDEEFVDRVDLDPKQFWQKNSESSVLPETAAPSPGAFQAVFVKAAEDGCDSVVAVMLSSELSATIQAAEAAAKACADTIVVHVVDSRTVSMGLGALVLQAATSAADGSDGAAIAEDIRERASRTRVHAALDTLENLKKGGRIGAAQSLLGSLLSIKPMIEVRDGSVEPTHKPRTRSKALAALIDIVRQSGEVQHLAVMHADCADVDNFVTQLGEVYSGEVIVGDIGAVIGAHAGPGAIGVTFQVTDQTATTTS